MKHTITTDFSSAPEGRGLFADGFDPDPAPPADESRLIQQILSTKPADRILAARSLASLPGRRYYYFVVRLLKDEDEAVRQAVLAETGYTDEAALWRDIVAAVGDIETRRVAAAMLVALGPVVIPTIHEHFSSAGKPARLRLIRVLERIGGSDAMAVLAEHLQQPDEVLRTAVIQALQRNHHGASHKIDDTRIAVIGQQIHRDTELAADLLAALTDLTTAPTSPPAALHFLTDVINTRLSRCRQRIAGYLALLPTERTLPQSQQDHEYIMAFLQASTPGQQRQQLQTLFSQPGLCRAERLIALLEQPHTLDDPWLWVCTAHAVIQLDLSDPRISTAMTTACREHPQDRLIRETVNTALARQYDTSAAAQAETKPATSSHHDGYRTMFSTIEKVIFLKGVNLFYETPDAILIELASLLEEVEVTAGRTIFEKNTAADCMYIIVEGRVKVHDGERVLNYQGKGEVFGELALLDEQPRLASITTLEDSRLLKLDQEGFYLLMEDHIEFARGVIRVLSGYLRGNLRNLTDPG